MPRPIRGSRLSRGRKRKKMQCAGWAKRHGTKVVDLTRHQAGGCVQSWVDYDRLLLMPIGRLSCPGIHGIERAVLVGTSDVNSYVLWN